MGERPKALLPVLTVAGVLAIAAVIAMVILLSRPQAPTAGATMTPPAAVPSATPTTSATSTADPSPSPGPTEATAAEIEVGATGITVVGDDGSDLFTYRWNGDAALAVAALTDVFGTAPDESITEGDGTHFPDYTSYRWGGFSLFDMIETDGGKPRTEYWQPSYAEFTVGAESGVALTAESGLTVGTSIDDVRALGPDEEVELSDGRVRIFFGTERDGFDTAEGGEGEYALIIGAVEEGAVDEIIYRPFSRL